MLKIEDFKKTITKNTRLLGLDLGKKRIGVAICDSNKKVATPYTTFIKGNLNDFLNELKKIISENNIQGLVIGNPINMDGTYGKSAQSVNDFSKLISKNISLPITLWDERLSSSAAYKLSSEIDVKAAKKIKKIDENSAAFILQGAIDFLNN